ncbi:MAG: GspE/PulE family protein [Kiritimatiellae bacterium]|jgi:type II secretory ATPase GspE/PulE/Tfp pilus assembly ATPase PilB-like protein|nr:GspE/PulE family protein [Kiritimatiellia bacterium]
MSERNFISSLLARTELFSDVQIAEIVGVSRESGESITSVIVSNDFVEENDFLEAFGKVLNLPFMRLADVDIEPEVLDLIPTKAVFQYNIIPLSLDDNGTIHIATNDPVDLSVNNAVRLVTNSARICWILSPSQDISSTIKRFYGLGAETVDKLMNDERFDMLDGVDNLHIDINEFDQEASIVKFVNQVVWEACQQDATDIHMEPMEDRLRIRYRIDGVLHEAPMPPQLNRFQAAIISRIKVMANLDIAEKRIPMDGRIGTRVKGEDLDIRVSTMPTIYGESISLRLLRRGGEFITIEDLGMDKRDEDVVTKIIHKPNGIVLVTGPTGSGKSTSLYSFLHEINKTDIRIMTAEDPIEYEMAGINQVLVRPDIGLTFAKTLRTFLRQDPDVIMVGEIRDFETSEIAIQASLTGHLVFSTLHTNDAAGAFTRLLDMGVEPYLLASAVEAVIAQRLVRRLCPNCRKPIEQDIEFLKGLEFPVEELKDNIIYEVGSCDKCRKTGFKGRRGIFEVLPVTEDIESLVITRSSSSEIKAQGLKDGMRSLRDDGWRKVLNGTTIIDEVLRVTEEDNR